MVLTAAQTTSFFTDDAQLGIPPATFTQMNAEGIEFADDLVDFDKDALKQLADNLRRPGGAVAVAAFVFGAKSQTRLKVACDLVRFYETVGRPLTAANIQWTPVMKNFKIQWDSLQRRKKEDRPETPKISKVLQILKWLPAFKDHLSRCIGVRDIPLSYVVRADVLVTAAAPALATDQPYSTLHGSVIGELVARASHAHAAYSDDNEEVYFMVEEATRGTQYAASIRPFSRAKNGREAVTAIEAQFAGVDKWTVVIGENEVLLHSRKWKGTGNFSLEHFIAQHRNAFVTITHAADHVPYQLPNERTRVRYLLDGIETSDAQLLTAIEAVRGDTTPTTGKAANFENAAAHLQPRCPVTRRQATRKRPTSVADASVSGLGGGKKSMGTSGVHLRWHKRAEYMALSPEQKQELYQWQQANPDDADASRSASNKGGDKSPNKKRKKGDGKGHATSKYSKKSVSKLVASEVAKALDKVTDDDKEEHDNAAQQASAASVKTELPTLQSILKKSLNGGNK